MQFYSFIQQKVVLYFPQNIKFIDQQKFDLRVIGYNYYKRLLQLYKLYFLLKQECSKINGLHLPNKQLTSLSILTLKQLYYDFIKKVEFIEDYTWEKLNTGNWKDIDTSWRLLYSHTFILKIMLNALIITSTGSIIPMMNFNHLLNYLPPISNLSAEEMDNFKMCHQLLIWCDKAILMGVPIVINGKNIFTLLGDNLCGYITMSNDYIASILDDPTATSLKFTNTVFINSVKKEITKPMEVRDEPTLGEFQNEVMKRGEPIVLLNILNDWPCFNPSSSAIEGNDTSNNKWSLAYLLKQCGPRLVPVEIGKRYTDENWFQELMPFWKFVKHYVLADTGSPKGYLAQHFLFDQILTLKEDFTIPLYCACSLSPPVQEHSQDYAFEDEVEVNCWFGPSGTVSPLHHDPKPNLLCQVLGSKYVRMFHPSQTDMLYPYANQQQQLGTNTSPVDVEKPDLEKYPNFTRAKYVECVLDPGQALFIPPGYWHFVKSLAPSFSINFWWQ